MTLVPHGFAKLFGLAAVAVGALLDPAAILHAQIPLLGSGPGGLVRIQNTDMAVLEAGEERRDLPCVVSPTKPFLGFDLRFHTGFEVSVPLRELSGSENLLTILFRVSHESRDDPQYFVQRIRVPSIEEDSKGDAFLQGGFDVGEGQYRVEWLMRDRTERVCSSSWDFTAELAGKDRSVEVTLAPGSIEPIEAEQFREEPPVERTQDKQPLRVKVLMNFAPQKSTSAALRPLDTAALVSLLRTISREPRINKFSLVAFNLQEQRVVFRQDDADRIDFPALGDSLNTINLGRVEFTQLSQKSPETDFLTGLLRKEFSPTEKPDAVIFAGPKAMLEESVPREDLEMLKNLEYPVFYMNYNLNPQSNPWRDTIGQAVRFLKGYEYTITRPRDLWNAVTEMVGRIVKSKSTREVATSSSQ